MKLTISPYRYELRYDSELSKNAGVLGLCLNDTLMILIDDTSAPQVQNETLLHEALHACWTQTHLDGKYTDEQEEEFIYTMSPRIYAFLRDNKEVVRKWLSSSA